MKLTIFTPTYNRAYRLPILYKSLAQQTNKNFEWIVVDDGSTDNTQQLFEKWQDENIFPITYVKQPNGGKHRAINHGVKVANGDFFFIVDSDDCLTNDAVEQILALATEAMNNSNCCGMCFRCKNIITGEILGTLFPKDGMLASSLEIPYVYHIDCDKSEVVKTEILKLYPFPEIKKENFVPEALIWNRIAEKYKFICKNAGIYLFEYLPDGLSKGFSLNLKRNPKGFSLYYKETMRRKIGLKNRLKFLIRYVQCCFYSLLK